MPPIPSEEQHERLEPTQTQLLKDRRFKLSRACDRCRRRRIKCDEGHPCQPCRHASSACTFEEAGKKSHPHKSKRATTLEERMAQLEQLIQSIPADIFLPQQGTGAVADDSPQAVEQQLPPVSATSAPSSLPQFEPMGIPPPSLSVNKLVNPATHFFPTLMPTLVPPAGESMTDTADTTWGLSLAPTYLYLDDEGSTRWQGEASGLPMLDRLVERHVPQLRGRPDRPSSVPNSTTVQPHPSEPKWFPDRQTSKRVEVSPERLWGQVTAAIPPDLMDNLVQCYLSTTYYLLPFLHVPTFLHDYGNPTKWGEPGFACFIIAICCLASRHSDDPRVRSEPTDSFSCGTHWFELLARLRSLPTADRPTLYAVQGIFISAIYAIGLGHLSRGFALLAEAITLSFDAGLHRSVEAYDCFDPIENEVRRRTFWSIYIWDKQVGAAFGRPPLVRLRDCDVPEPSPVDDEFITKSGIVQPPPGSPPPRMTAFIAALRLFVVMESVLDTPPPSRPNRLGFFAHAAHTLTGFNRHSLLNEEETLLDEVVGAIDPYWQCTSEVDVGRGGGEHVIQTTQSHRLRCLEQWIRMLIHRHRLATAIVTSEFIPTNDDVETQEMISCQQAAINVIHSQLQMATHGLMGFFGVAVIHQVNQAGRTLVAVLLNCKSPLTQSMLTEPAMEALRSCLVLLRRFSVRYLCGLRSADLIEEFCRVSGIPFVGAPPASANGQQTPRRAWLRPVRKKQQSTPGGSGGTPEGSEPSPAQESCVPDVHDIFDLNAAAASVSPSTHGSGSGSGGMMHSPNALMSDPSHSQHLQMQQGSQQHSPNPQCNVLQQPTTFFGAGVWMSTSPGILGGFGTSPQAGTGGGNGMNGVHQPGDTDLLALLTSSHYDQAYELGGLYSPGSTSFTGGHTDTLAALNGGASGLQMPNGTGNRRSPEVGI